MIFISILSTILGLTFVIKGPSPFLFILLFFYLLYLFCLKERWMKTYLPAFLSFWLYVIVGYIYEYQNESVLVEGSWQGIVEIKELPKIDGNRMMTVVVTEQGEKLQVRSYLRLEEEKERFKTISAGDVCYMDGQLETPQKATNFFGFNYAEFLYFNQIHWLFAVEPSSVTCQTREGTWGQSLQNFRQQQMYQLEERLDPEIAGMMIALLFGERMFFEEEILNAYQRLGVFHLLAISGLHVGLIISALFYLMIRFGVSRERTQELLICFLPIYALLAGAAPPVMRACGMTMIVLLSLRLQKRIPSLLAISAVFFLYLLVNPYALFQLGFQLSFLISFGLILSSQTISRRYTSYFSRLFIVSALAQLLSLPFLLYHFFEQSWLQIPLNLFYIPLISLIILPLVFTTYFLSFVLPFMSDWLLLFLVNVLSNVHIGLQVIENWSFHYFTVGRPNSFSLLAISFLLLFTFLLWERGKRGWWKLVLCGWSLLVALHLIIPYLDPTTKITMIDIGQGDSFLIELPFNQATYLLDTGGTIRFQEEDWQIRRSQFEVGEDVLVPFLKAKGIRKIDKLILSHGDFDHVGGVLAVLKHVKVKEILYPKGPMDEGEIALFQQWQPYGADLTFIEKGEYWSVGNAEFYVLAPTGVESGRNERSMVLYAVLDGLSWLFTGDLEEEGERRLVQNFPRMTVDVLKVGHHGSRTSTTDLLLNHLQPQIAFISAGRNNRFGHPHPDVVHRLQEEGVIIYRTDLDGAVVMQLKGSERKVQTKLIRE
ncbi:DNA internalization-related competence protein ComEC/Rec2 [Alkalihalobacillus sp. 1P02AB]|uniref:DNA internalization-related competence protein ComEC/Rec2 n=1 Tax=Alkalihalobacillus sp. 1P02AB TaxID=3132260 RepID=UPI0039A57A52